jgi:hypothetical protein
MISYGDMHSQHERLSLNGRATNSRPVVEAVQQRFRVMFAWWSANRIEYQELSLTSPVLS